jgi:hypothetical protein
MASYRPSSSSECMMRYSRRSGVAARVRETETGCAWDCSLKRSRAAHGRGLSRAATWRDRFAGPANRRVAEFHTLAGRETRTLATKNLGRRVDAPRGTFGSVGPIVTSRTAPVAGPIIARYRAIGGQVPLVAGESNVDAVQPSSTNTTCAVQRDIAADFP